MTVIRKKPNFDIDQAFKSILYGSIVGIISIGFSILFVFMLLQTIREKHFITAAFTGLCFVPAMIFQSLMSIKVVWDGIATVIKKLNWLKNAVIFQATIVDREETYYDNHGYEDSYYICKLALNVIPNQSIDKPDESVVWAQVNKLLYDRYANKNIISIHYSTEDPFTFLFEGE